MKQVILYILVHEGVLTYMGSPPTLAVKIRPVVKGDVTHSLPQFNK
jgi:hypothetical protein